MINANERLGRPSASAWRRYELCSGSYQLEQQAKELGQEAHTKSPEADSGDRIHARLAGQEITLTDAETETARFLE